MRKRREIKFITNENGCHICISHKTDEYGYVRYKTDEGKSVRMHRHIYEQLNGRIPEGMLVRHTCDIRDCINSAHLELGTRQDNMDDMVKRGRSLYGEKNPNSKLTEQQIVEIKSSKRTHKELAEIYGVGKKCIDKITAGERWERGIESVD